MIIVLLLALLLVPHTALAQAVAEAPHVFTAEEMREMLLKGKVIKSRDTSKGVTSPKRLTLSLNGRTHDAAFQSVDEHNTVANLSGKGRAPTVELNFIDHYRYNLGRLCAGRPARPRLHDADARQAELVGQGRLAQLVGRRADG